MIEAFGKVPKMPLCLELLGGIPGFNIGAGVLTGIGLYAFNSWIHERKMTLDGILISAIFGGAGGAISFGSVTSLIIGTGLGVTEHFAKANIRPFAWAADRIKEFLAELVDLIIPRPRRIA